MGKAFIQSETKLFKRKEESSASHSKSRDGKAQKNKMTVIRTFEASRFSEEVIAEAYGRLLPTSYLVAMGQSHRTGPENHRFITDAAKSISI